MKMSRMDVVVSVVILLSGTVLTRAVALGRGSRCYECNYMPAGFTHTGEERKKLNPMAGSGEIGTNLCALQSQIDSDRLDKWTCKSGTCYIRRDPNGMVYRGCGDPNKLPWAVDPRNQCGYMGPGKEKSQWFFCQGDLCNDGYFGAPDRCGVPPSRARARDAGFGDGAESIPGSKRLGFTDLNPCDGNCRNNPSGLYPDRFSPRHFIQCGSDFKHGKSCKCCKRYRRKCPDNSQFDDRAKVCNINYQQRAY